MRTDRNYKGESIGRAILGQQQKLIFLAAQNFFETNRELLGQHARPFLKEWKSDSDLFSPLKHDSSKIQLVDYSHDSKSPMCSSGEQKQQNNPRWGFKPSHDESEQ